MFLLIGFNLLTTIAAAAKDDNELYIKMNPGISRKLLRVNTYRPLPPIPNPSVRWPPNLK
ncbi:hypothetical protein MKX01_040528 [Papaver californicum]|nr:hypothetical protein MKX01_040528 [Papaver californicum]